MRTGVLRAGLTMAAILCLTAVGLAQRGGRGGIQRPVDEEGIMPAREGEFHFIRMEYIDMPGSRRGFGYSSRDGSGTGWWLMDWPASENHFTTGIGRLTRIDAGDPRHFRITDDRIFNYPWIYATQVGWWDLSDAETLRLREYLLRGGYLVVDDFWGAEQWEVFRQTMSRVLPGKPILDLAHSDAVMHVLYDIEDKDLTSIPGSRHLYRGPGGSVQINLPPASDPAWRSMYDDRGRMVVAVNYNTDVGDAWEFADVPYYPAAMTMLAYRYGINYIIYSMTH